MLTKRLVTAFFMVLALAALAPGRALANVSVNVDVGLFYDNLAGYGEWVEASDYGWAWVPHVAKTWRPYTLGHWAWTDEYGWLWVSDEQFGWAVYHYGRWVSNPRYGWVWVPGTEWGPAWVSWRSGGGYIGWAPLPPRVAWSGGSFGISIGGFDAFIQPRHYCFVREASFIDPFVYRKFVPGVQVDTVIRQTRNVTDYASVGGRVMNRSIRLAEVKRAAGREVPRVRVVDADSVKALRQRRGNGREVAVFRAQVQQRADRTPPRGRRLQEALEPQRATARETDKRQARQPDQQQHDREMQRSAQRDRDRHLGANRQTEGKQLTRQQDRQQDAQQRANRDREATSQRERERERAFDAQRQRKNQDRHPPDTGKQLTNQPDRGQQHYEVQKQREAARAAEQQRNQQREAQAQQQRAQGRQEQAQAQHEQRQQQRAEQGPQQRGPDRPPRQERQGGGREKQHGDHKPPRD